MNWQPIDTAPKDGGEILAHDGIGYSIVQWVYCAPVYNDGPEFGWAGDYDHLAKRFFEESPTHWMPLPAIPTNEDTM